MGREGGCTTGLSPVAAHKTTTIHALSTSVRRRGAHVHMDGVRRRTARALRYTLGRALLLERVGRTFLQLDLHTPQGVSCVQRQSLSVCEHTLECARAPQQRYARK